MPDDPRSQVEGALGAAVRTLRGLSGGCIGDVYHADLADGRQVVVKIDGGREPRLDVEGYMLRYLAEHSDLPVPGVLHSTPRLLVMEYVEGSSHFSNAAETHAADLLSALHGIRAESYGLEQDTLIGGLHQPNPWTTSWLDFFRDQRLLYMAGVAHKAGRMSKAVLRRIGQFAGKLDGLLEAPPHPSLLHGDVWTTNVLADGNRISAFLDPAVYYGHPEIELAFITLFHTFGDHFFSRYAERRGIADGFFETRRDIYNLYPLLVHVRLFGGGYLSGVEQVLRHHGC